MAKYIFSPWRPVATTKGKEKKQEAHRAGWTLLWAEQLGAKVLHNEPIPDDCEMLYAELGMEFDQTFPSFNSVTSGKMWDGLYEYFDHWITYTEKGGKTTFLDWYTDGYQARCWAERLWFRYDLHEFQWRRLQAGDESIAPMTGNFATLFPHRVQQLVRVSRTKPLFQKDLPFKSLTLGDSHSISAWLPGSKAYRIDGQTLYGALKKGLGTYLQEMNMQPGMDSLRTYFGNIDIRHHLCRLCTDQKSQEGATIRLVTEYVRQLKELKETYRIENISVVDTLPIEHESRRIPGTGCYPEGKTGQPFWGSWDERMHVHKTFNQTLRTLRKQDPFFEIVEWPSKFSLAEDITIMSNNAGGVESHIKDQKPPVPLIHRRGSLDYDVMEVRGSVHLIPEHYLWSDRFSVWTEREKFYGDN